MENRRPMATMEASLEFQLMLQMSGEDGVARQVSLGDIRRGEVDDVALLGLELSEGKQLLSRLQHEIVTKQFESMTRKRQACACCGAPQSIKDYQPARFRSLFGDVELRVPRHVKCGCADARVGQRAPRRRWVSAELECVQSELAATMWSCPARWCKSTTRIELRCAVLSGSQRTAEWGQYRFYVDPRVKPSRRRS